METPSVSGLRKSVCNALVLLCACLTASAASRPVLMISIDGLKPEYVTQADAHGLKIATLRRFLTKGTYADGVVGVMPTVTYPSHTTLITGVWPVAHGIYDNGVFDPFRTFGGAWYWYGKDIRVSPYGRRQGHGHDDSKRKLAGQRGRKGRRLSDSGILANRSRRRNQSRRSPSDGGAQPSLGPARPACEYRPRHRPLHDGQRHLC
jgi:hypothetical protein